MFALVDGRLYGSPQPSREDLEGFLEAGVELVISLTVHPLGPTLQKALRAMEIDYLHEPVRDFMPPSMGQMDEIYEAYSAVAERGGAMLVHCGAGIGRTGTVLSCIIGAEERLSAREAMKRVREARPNAVETTAQRQFIADWLEHHRKSVGRRGGRKGRKKRRGRRD